MAWDRKVPFDRLGNLLNYVSNPTYPTEWRPLYTFKAVLTFKRIFFSHAIFVDEQRHESSFTMNDFERLIPALMDGWVSGEWTFRKRGTYFFVVPVGR